jgi:hypothetical protein
MMGLCQADDPVLTAKLGARKKRLGSAHQCEDNTERNLAGAIDLEEYSMLCDLTPSKYKS